MKKILAVIPARAGSKGIPNKNLRIVAGHPLVYYAIQNARKSKLITDVIVTTDSEEVRIIANQLGVKVKLRNEALCGDSVTLDSVIYDAIPNENFDYIITMQPTSPTLKSTTLDSAINYSIDNNMDTVISVYNNPHLSWRKEQEKIIPNYKERLNRQYLPPCYIETGAFVISKTSVVNENTRIGNKVDVYEISDVEAVDVDTFEDLKQIDFLLNKSKIAIYVNGNNKMGMGHIYRALELADEFYSKPDIYYDINQTDKKVFGNTTHTLIPVDGEDELLIRCKENKYNIFINDILSTDVSYMEKLRRCLPNSRVINFEDDGVGSKLADIVFNALLYDELKSNVYSGEKYYICGKSFLFYEPITISEKVEKVFISFGGADPMNYTDRLLSIISSDYYKSIQFVVVLGKAKTNVDELLQYNNKDNIQVLYNVSNMPELMSSCDIAITSRGRTGYELAILGIPTISIAQNEREESHKFMCNENGFTYIGKNPNDEIIESTLKMYLSLSKDSRIEFQNKMMRFNLKDGRKNIINIINNL